MVDEEKPPERDEKKPPEGDEKKTRSKPERWVMKWLGIVGLAMFAVWGLAMWIPYLSYGGDFATAGQLGDSMGTVNALFSGLALAAVAISVLLQARELRENTEAVSRQAEAQEAANQLKEMELADSKAALNRQMAAQEEANHLTKKAMTDEAAHRMQMMALEDERHQPVWTRVIATGDQGEYGKLKFRNSGAEIREVEIWFEGLKKSMPIVRQGEDLLFPFAQARGVPAHGTCQVRYRDTRGKLWFAVLLFNLSTGRIQTVGPQEPKVDTE